MPTKNDLELLAKIAEGQAPVPDAGMPPAFPADEVPTLSRDSKVHVSVHVDRKDTDPPAKRNIAQQIADSSWAKLVGALLLGAGGGEGHRLLSPTGLVDRADFDQYKQEIARELGKEDEKAASTAKQLSDGIAASRADRDEDRKAMYALGRYLYFVLPKTGILMTLPEDVQRPPPMDFHPPPLFMNVTPNGARPIQPAETFPLPFALPK